MEHVLSRIWSTVLGLPGLDRGQGLFASGIVHVLSVLRARERIALALRVDVPLSTMLQCQTMAQLARSVRASADSVEKLEVRAWAVASLAPLEDAEWVRAVTALETEAK
ncbi:hypothetical protein GCM10010358_78210 [Streptomyces minutiscleroticus]|uniref:Carrier domain-containing protein n=1 Tax=Streptomyces minutiscleroticus TaxID=68238 RepID=A0A918P2A8_9ACTN|nr:phosphopantetheine-binding protein [Streptomyces minutiscleroticus]GGY14428.1 hypothetical protein GCM10010358_78210 [Streptomyces minutiscleroticus]